MGRINIRRIRRKVKNLPILNLNYANKKCVTLNIIHNFFDSQLKSLAYFLKENFKSYKLHKFYINFIFIHKSKIKYKNV